MKNHLIHTLGLVLLLLLVLLLMSELPLLKIGGRTLRQVDLLSDVRVIAPEPEPDTVLLPPVPIIKPAFVDTCRTGVTCIEDYGDSTERGMIPFYRALASMDSLDRPVRIAVFGDSFIEGDIFTADLREMLQQKYGGCGVGYVDITSRVYGFRPTVRHSFKGWKSFATNDSAYFDRSRQGISSRYFIPTAGAYVELRGQDKYASLLDTCRQSTIYYSTKGNLQLRASINGQSVGIQTTVPSSRVQKMTIDGNIGRVRWTVDQADSALFYGVTLEGTNGVVLDNFSLRGSSGISLRYIPEKMLTDFNALRAYDLIILQYGLNVATTRGSNYDYYKKGLLATIDYLKRCFPQTGFLLLSVGDRQYKTDSGEMRTMAGVKNLLRYQQHIAAEGGIAFWNLYEAMGGEGSMAGLVQAKPPKANLDYTHINFKGGKHLANFLYEALVDGKEQYDRRSAYEKE